MDRNGELDLDELRAALRPDTALVSIMLANNETGVLFPIEEIGRIVREKSEAVFHVDGVQAVGKIPIDLKNTVSICLRFQVTSCTRRKASARFTFAKEFRLPPLIIGGAQEQGRRAGTSAVPNIVGLGAACRLAHEDDDHARIETSAQSSRRRDSRNDSQRASKRRCRSFEAFAKHVEHLF